MPPPVIAGPSAVGPTTLILCLLAAIVLVWIGERLFRWRRKQWLDRVVKDTIASASDPSAPRPKLSPEGDYVIELSTGGVSCRHPDGVIERVDWDDLQRVEILTNSDGPLLPDCFWVLHGSQSGCLIPWGATGDGELLERLQQLPGFDNHAVIGSSGKTEESVTVCWQKAGL